MSDLKVVAPSWPEFPAHPDSIKVLQEVLADVEAGRVTCLMLVAVKGNQKARSFFANQSHLKNEGSRCIVEATTMINQVMRDWDVGT